MMTQQRYADASRFLRRCGERYAFGERAVMGGLPSLVLALLCLGWLGQVPVACADVYMRQDGGAVTLTNVPESDGYSIMLVEPAEQSARSAPDRSDAAELVARPGVGGGIGRPATGAAGPGSGGGAAPFLGHVRAAASRYGVPEALLHAVIRVESNFNPRAVSPRGARGLMQLMPATASWLGVADAFDPVENIDAGARYLRQLLDEFDQDVHLAVAAYNAGPTAVKRWGGVPRFTETEQYVPRVLGHFEALGGRLPLRPVSRWR